MVDVVVVVEVVVLVEVILEVVFGDVVEVVVVVVLVTSCAVSRIQYSNYFHLMVAHSSDNLLRSPPMMSHQSPDQQFSIDIPYRSFQQSDYPEP